jgi:integrase
MESAAASPDSSSMPWIRSRRSGFIVCWRDEHRRERSRYFPTREAAEAFVPEAEQLGKYALVLSRAPGIPGWDSASEPARAIDDGFSFADFLRSAIERDRSLRPSSQDTYMHSLRNHIAGTPFGQADVRTIRPEDVRDFWDGLRKLGPGALRNVKQLLSKGFNAAVREGARKDNPMLRAAIRAPAKERQVEVVPLTVDEVERLAAAAGSERNKLLILLMAYGGLRAGEVGGLRVVDVDVAQCQVHIRQQVVYERGRGPVIGPLKTRATRRTVPIPCSIAEELGEYLRSEAIADGFVFGAVAHVAVNHAVQRAAKRAGMRPVHAHLLRHTAVSLLIDDGVNPRAIQAFVGHSDIKMTLGVYGHLFPYGGQALADSMERRRGSSPERLASTACSHARSSAATRSRRSRSRKGSLAPTA